jgi:hypothetical protein
VRLTWPLSGIGGAETVELKNDRIVKPSASAAITMGSTVTPPEATGCV